MYSIILVGSRHSIDLTLYLKCGKKIKFKNIESKISSTEPATYQASRL